MSKPELQKFTIVELWDRYMETKNVLEDYTFDDLIYDILREETQRLVGGSGMTQEEDRGSIMDQYPEQFTQEVGI